MVLRSGLVFVNLLRKTNDFIHMINLLSEAYDFMKIINLVIRIISMLIKWKGLLSEEKKRKNLFW